MSRLGRFVSCLKRELTHVASGLRCLSGRVTMEGSWILRIS